MARILEHDVKKLLRLSGVPVPKGEAARSPAAAREAAHAIGVPVVVKALVPTGKRGKAGGVKFAFSPPEAAEQAGVLLQMTVRDYPVEAVLVEEKLEIQQELYLSFVFDTRSRGPVILVSALGGVDIEETVAADPEAVNMLPVDVSTGPSWEDVMALWESVGLSGRALEECTTITLACYKTYQKYDGETLEINPLAILPGERVVAAAALMDVDGEALFRHPELEGLTSYALDRYGREPTEREAAVLAADRAEPNRGAVKFREFPGTGDIGFLVTGGGGSMITIDMIERLGGTVANYVDLSPGYSREKLNTLAEAVFTIPGIKAVIVGGCRKSNMRVDLFVEACMNAQKRLQRPVPIVARLVGLEQEAAGRLAAECPGMEFYGDEITLDDAVRRVVHVANQGV